MIIISYYHCLLTLSSHRLEIKEKSFHCTISCSLSLSFSLRYVFFVFLFPPFFLLRSLVSRTRRYSGWVAPSSELSWTGSNGGPGPLEARREGRSIVDSKRVCSQGWNPVAATMSTHVCVRRGAKRSGSREKISWMRTREWPSKISRAIRHRGPGRCLRIK